MSTPPTEQPGDALLQQGMSPTYQDEDRVPAQGDAAPDPLRHDREVPPPGMTRTLLNGTPPDSGIAAPRSEMELPVLASGNEGNMASQDRAREISAEGTVPMAGVTAPPLTTSSQAGLSLPLFQNFVPSPLPGQSPVAQQQGGTRTSWLTKLGDYIQKRVEVTSWASPPSTSIQQQQPGIWHNQSQVQTMVVASPLARERRPESSSSGSAGIPQEMVQAEVARQLDSAMSDVMGRLQAERQRTEHAMQEARQLREQLEIYETREREVRTGHFGPPPGFPPLSSGEPGASTGVPANHPLPGPMSSITMQDSERERATAARGDVDKLPQGSDLLEGSRLPGGDRAYKALGVDPGVYEPEASAGVPANHPLPGPF